MVKITNLGLYPGQLVIIQKKNLKNIPEKYKPEDCKLKEYDALTCRRTKKTGLKQYILIFRKPTEVKTIAHESLHCVNDIFDTLQIDYDKHNDEHAAYLLGYIVKTCLKYLKYE